MSRLKIAFVLFGVFGLGSVAGNFSKNSPIEKIKTVTKIISGEKEIIHTERTVKTLPQYSFGLSVNPFKYEEVRAWEISGGYRIFPQVWIEVHTDLDDVKIGAKIEF